MNNIPVYKIGVDTPLTNNLIMNIVSDYTTRKLPRLKRLYNYYLGHTDIVTRVMADPLKPNNKIVNAYANNITNTMTGYFMGNPVAYKLGDDANYELLQNVFDNNDEDEEDSILAKDASIFGFGAEIAYINEDARIRFTRVSPIGIIIITDDTVEEKIRYVIRLNEKSEIERGINATEYTLYIYDDTSVNVYNYNNGALSYLNSYDHQMGMVPITIYKNNDEMIGDFELVMSLIDAYDKLQSDGLNDFEAFVDAYLVLQCMDLTDEEAAKMRENRILILPEGAEAKWLVKDQQDQYIGNLKDNIDKNIYKFASCPNMADESFSGNLSGIAIKYKVMNMENVCATKERYFRAALYRRIDLINNILTLFGSPVDVNEIEITFTRNLPVNNTENADLVNKLSSLVSKETLLSLLPFIDDVDAEMERKEGERADYLASIFHEDADTDENQHIDEA